MDPKKVKANPKNMDITASNKEFRFQPKTRGRRSIKLGPKTRKGGTLVSTSGLGEIVPPIIEVLPLLLLRNLKGGQGYPRLLKMMP